MLIQHAPTTIRLTRQIEGYNAQMGTANGVHAMHGAQVAGLSEDQPCWQQALCQQLLRSVNIRHDFFEQTRALPHADFNLMPVGRLNQPRQHLRLAQGLCLNVMNRAKKHFPHRRQRPINWLAAGHTATQLVKMPAVSWATHCG